MDDAWKDASMEGWMLNGWMLGGMDVKWMDAKWMDAWMDDASRKDGWMHDALMDARRMDYGCMDRSKDVYLTNRCTQTQNQLTAILFISSIFAVGVSITVPVFSDAASIRAAELFIRALPLIWTHIQAQQGIEILAVGKNYWFILFTGFGMKGVWQKLLVKLGRNEKLTNKSQFHPIWKIKINARCRPWRTD